MQDVTAATKAPFERYLCARNARRFSAVAACYHEARRLVSPETAPQAGNRADPVALKELFAGLATKGFSHNEAGRNTAGTCGATRVVIAATAVTVLRRDTAVPGVIDRHDTAGQLGRRWFFTVATVCAAGRKGPRNG